MPSTTRRAKVNALKIGRRKNENALQSMNPAFLDALASLSTDNAEYFRTQGIAATLTARSEGRPKNSQGLNMSHANWQASLVVWDSGEAKLSANVNKTGANTIRDKRYGSPAQMRENLREWLFQNVRA